MPVDLWQKNCYLVKQKGQRWITYPKGQNSLLKSLKMKKIRNKASKTFLSGSENQAQYLFWQMKHICKNTYKMIRIYSTGWKMYFGNCILADMLFQGQGTISILVLSDWIMHVRTHFCNYNISGSPVENIKLRKGGGVNASCINSAPPQFSKINSIVLAKWISLQEKAA